MSEQDTSGTSDQLWIFEGLALFLIVAVLLACWGYILFGDYERLEAPPPKPEEIEGATSGPAEGATSEPAKGATSGPTEGATTGPTTPPAE